MLTKKEKSLLVSLAMQAELECYSAYFMQEAAKLLAKIIQRCGSRVVWDFMKKACCTTYRLYLELCLLGPSAKKENNISYKI